MADGGASGIKQVTEETAQAAGEVTKGVKDSIGEMIEQNVQIAVGTKLTPQQLQPFDNAQGRQKQQEDQKKELDRQKQLAYTRSWLKKLEAEQKRVRMEQKQKLQQKQPIEEQEKQKKKMEEAQKKQVIISPAKPVGLREDIARTQMERSKGRGVGG